jgi:predicted dehydrogenase
MTGKLKYGIAGCGGIAAGKHLPALEKIKDIEVAAYCDIIRERAEAYNRKYSDGKAKVFSDYHDLIQEDLDAVLVLTPNRSHSEITVAALDAGKNVLCEKPMAINYKEAQAMIAARDRNKKLLTIGYQYRFRPDCLYLKAECEDGALGEIYYARATWLRRRGVPTWGVFLNETEQGGGPLIDIGTHALDLTLFMMDNYEPAYAVGSVYHKYFMIFCRRGNLYPTGYRGRRRLFRVVRERSGGNLWQTSSQIIIATAAEENNEGQRFGAAISDRISVYPEQRPLFRQFYL